jgi:hypothetical protein
LDFAPVAKLLPTNDPRRTESPKTRKADVAGLSELLKVAPRVVGEGGAVERLIKRINSGRVNAAVISALDDRARELAVDLKAFREAIDGLKK